MQTNSANTQTVLKEYSEAYEQLNALTNLIINMNQKTDEELNYLGYTTDQIYAIRNFDGSDEMLSRASGNITGTVFLSEHSYSGGRTFVTVNFNGNYNGQFIQQFQDYIGIGVVGSNCWFPVVSASCQLTYADGHINYASYSDSGPGGRFKFGIQNLRSFSASYRGVAQGNITVLRYGAAYGHNFVSPTLGGLSIDGDYNLGLSFSVDRSTDLVFQQAYTKY